MSEPRKLVIKPGSKEWEQLRRRARNDLYWFCAKVLGLEKLIPMSPRAHYAMCRFAERKTGFPRIDDCRIQLIQVPRGVGKTALITNGRTTQRLIQDQNWAAGIANEKQDNANAFLATIKAQFESNEFLQALFPECIPNFRQTDWRSDRIVINRTRPNPISPSVLAAGANATVTGVHMNEWIVDDIISQDAAENARAGLFTELEKSKRWCERLHPLLQSPERDPITFIGTPWFLGDVYDWLVEERYGRDQPEEVYEMLLDLPDGYKQTVTLCRRGDIAVFRLPAVDEHGQPLFPERYDLAELDKMRRRDPVFYCLPSGVDIQGKLVEELTVGDMLLAHDGQRHVVSNSFARPFTGDLVSIKAWGTHRPLLLTPNHKVATVEGYKRADAVTNYDWLIQPVLEGQACTIPEFLQHPDMWWLLGHWLGDGSLSAIEKDYKDKHYKHYNATHVSAVYERHFADKVSAIVRKHLKRRGRVFAKHSASGYKAGSVWAVSYAHKDFCLFLNECRLGKPGHKVLPAWVEHAPQEYLEQLLVGYLDADGYTLPNGDPCVNSVCLLLLEQIQRIGNRLGMTCLVTTTGPSKRGNQELFHMRFRNDAKMKLRRGSWVRVVNTGSKVLHRVRNVERVEYAGLVHNVEVEEAHSFTLGNLVVGNSSQYLLNPAAEAAAFKPEWLREYEWETEKQLRFKNSSGKVEFLRVQELTTIISVDPAISESSAAARSAIDVVGTDGRRLFLLEAWADRVGATDLGTKVIELYRKYPNTLKVIIEGVAYQMALAEVIDLLTKEQKLPHRLPIYEHRTGPTQKKELRILGLEPYFKKGLFYYHPSMRAFHEEYCNFPHIKNRDLLDALSFQKDVWESLATMTDERGGVVREWRRASAEKAAKIRERFSMNRRR